MLKPDFHLLCLDTRPTRRGAQVFVQELSDILIARGLRVTKVYLYSAPEEGKLELNAQDIVLGGNDKHIFEKIPTVHPSLVRKLVKTLDSLKPDIVLLNGSRTLKYGSAAKPFLKNKPVFLYRVIDSVKFWNNSKFKQWYYRSIVLPAIDAAVGVSKTSLNEMISFHHFSKPAKAIPRAVDAGRFTSSQSKEVYKVNLQIQPAQFVVLYLGNLTPQKRPDRFLTIIELLKKHIPAIKALMVGDGVLRTQIEQEISRKDLADTIVLCGYQKQVAPYILASDILLLCSDTEGLPGVVLEAAAAGLPTVAARVGGVEECIDDGVTGSIVERDDVNGYVSQVLTYYNNSDKLTEAGAKAKSKILAEYNIDKVATAYITYFEELIK